MQETINEFLLAAMLLSRDLSAVARTRSGSSADRPLETFLETEVCTGFLDRLERCPVSCWSPPLAPDMTVCGCLLSRSLLGVKRTCRFALHMSAFDPKRTSGLSRCHGSPALI